MNTTKTSTAVKDLTWPTERTAQLRELAAQGLSASEIAVRLGCGLTRGAVSRKAKRIKIKLVHSARRKSRALVVKKTAMRHDVFWTPDRLQHLHDVLPSGMSAAEVARDLGTTKAAVVGKLTRMGWTLKGKPRTVRVLSDDERTKVLRLFAAGESIRSTVRQTGIGKHAVGVLRKAAQFKENQSVPVQPIPTKPMPVTLKTLALSDLRGDARKIVARHDGRKWVYAVSDKDLHKLRDEGFVETVQEWLEGVLVLSAWLSRDGERRLGKRAA